MRGMKRFVFVAALCLTMVVGAVGLTDIALAAPVDVLNNTTCTGNKICQNDGKGVFDILGRIINILLIVGGFIAVLMVIIGGITYSLSGGDAAQTKRGKDTVLYAVIGLVVSIMAFAIVNFVIGRL